ncbi:DUF4293 domain-containing protein [Reichenbachiella agarivorans]|uniref:DUF4293 domain-containing protein n=1 Tax=Reichenbachiella agarivorans TaxID=2979464 RepID=A0ABY6CT83_9BACT|nr:DUF4293 domain-containing protein [Reichenbachiella agarivorans]UXP32593.1 DUF4293 domain-containing protein [Reichenbachiella agarivorans]
MIQRIQSVFLFLVAASLITLTFFPLWNKVDPAKSEMVKLTVMELTHTKVDIDTHEEQLIAQTPTFYIALVALIAAGIALYSISQYKNRLLQMKLGALNSLVMAGALGLSVYFIFQGEKMIAPEQQGNYLFGFYLFVSAMLFNTLANRFIRKDEQLVKSADRIR